MFGVAFATSNLTSKIHLEKDLLFRKQSFEKAGKSNTCPLKTGQKNQLWIKN